MRILVIVLGVAAFVYSATDYNPYTPHISYRDPQRIGMALGCAAIAAGFLWKRFGIR